MALGRGQHPLALAQHVRQGLLDVDVLAGGAGEDGHQRVPVVGRRDDHGVDVRAIEHAAEVVEARRRVAGGLHAIGHPLVRHLGDAGDLAIRLCLEVQQVAAPDEPDADESDANAIVGAHHTARGDSRRGRGARQRLQECSALMHLFGLQPSVFSDFAGCCCAFSLRVGRACGPGPLSPRNPEGRRPKTEGGTSPATYITAAAKLVVSGRDHTARFSGQHGRRDRVSGQPVRDAAGGWKAGAAAAEITPPAGSGYERITAGRARATRRTQPVPGI